MYSFKTNYPNWKPVGNGKQLMSVLANFRQKTEENDLAMGQLFSSVRLPNQLGPPMPGTSHYTCSVTSSARDGVGHIVNIPSASYTDLQRAAAE